MSTQGEDAQITLGTGAGSYAVTSATNSFANIVNGVTITVKQASSEVVTATVGDNAGAIADKVKSLVDSVNAAIVEIKGRTSYDPKTNAAASLAGDQVASRAALALQRAVSDAVSQSALGSPGLAGVSLDRSGNVTFDRDKFLSAYAADPTAVQRLFVQGATTTGSVQFVSAGDRAQGGEREVIVTQAAAKAQTVGMVGVAVITQPATIRFKLPNGTEIVYTATIGQTQADVAAGLQSAFDSAGAGLSATLGGGGIEVSSDAYGTAGNYSVDWDTGSYSTVQGTNIAGTIGGVAATGTGRTLSVPSTDGSLGGLSVTVTTDTTGSVGSVDYAPGLAQRLSSAVKTATDIVDGTLVTAEAGRQSRIDMLSDSIAGYEQRLTLREARLKTQFAAMETMLSTLKGQSSWLSSQISGLSNDD
ncbi:MAG: flagellar filament capping protein FliD [Microthrixaceae bacterium]